MAVQPKPPGYHSVTPYLIVADASAALDFYARAFGAEELCRFPMGGRIGHSEMRIGDSRVMVSDEWPDYGCRGPNAYGGTPVGLMIYVPDADTAFDRAVQAGATVDRPVTDHFYGDRSGTLVDPFGHKWTLSTHVEDVPDDEIRRRMNAMEADAGKG